LHANDSLSINGPSSTNHSSETVEAAPGQVEAGISSTTDDVRPIRTKLVEVETSVYEEDKDITIEEVHQTDGVDWNLSSATLTNPEETLPQLVTLMVKALEAAALKMRALPTNPPSKDFARAKTIRRRVTLFIIKTINVPYGTSTYISDGYVL